MTSTKELRALADAACDGPWHVESSGTPGIAEVYTRLRHPDGVEINIADDLRASDAAFIAAARTAVPELLDEVERLRLAAEFARVWLDNLFGVSGALSCDEVCILVDHERGCRDSDPADVTAGACDCPGAHMMRTLGEARDRLAKALAR